MSTPLFRFTTRINRITKLLILSALLSLIGCIDQEDIDAIEPSSTSYSDTIIEGQATNSVIENGIVRTYQISHSEDQSKASIYPFGLPVRTDINGHFSLRLPNTVHPDSILIKITADQDTLITCDVISGCPKNASDTSTTFGNKFSLDTNYEISAILPIVEHGFLNTVNISVLSHLAASHAKNKEKGLTNENVNASYRYIEALMGLGSGALQLTPPDLTKLNSYADLNKTAIKTSIISASFLALLHSPDWDNISEIINHAADRIASSGALTAANMSALPDVALDDLFYKASEISQNLLSQTDNPKLQSNLAKISSEVEAAYDLTTIVPELIDPVEISQHPVSLTVNEASPASFSVYALGDDNLNFQWRFNGNPIPEASEATYTISQANITDMGTYDVIVSNSVGSQVSLSALLVVHVITQKPTPVNTPPIGHNDTIEVFEDTITTIHVLDNDSDPDNEQLTITQATVAEGTGSVTVENIPTNTDQSSNVLVFTPGLNANSSSSIRYSISDNRGGNATAYVSVSILPINDAPESFPDSAVMQEDASLIIDVLANDTDADNDNLTISSAASASGQVTITSNDTLLFQPYESFNGMATISYIIEDGHGGISSSAATVTINAVNDAPIAINDVTSTLEDTPVSINVLNNDTDPEGHTLKISQVSASSGEVIINANNTITFSPAENMYGTSILSYAITDEDGGTSSAKVTVSILSVNDAPVLVNDTATTDEDIPTIINILGNDIDVDSDNLTITDAHAISSGGIVSINRDQTLTFVPNDDFNGDVALSYTVSDNHGGMSTASVSIAVHPTNDLPVLVNHHASTDQATDLTVDALLGAYDIDGNTLKIIESSALNGAVTLIGNGFITYHPEADFSGEDTIKYTVSDGQQGISSAFITVNVNEGNKTSTISLSWEIPTQRRNGTPLYRSDIKGYQIAYGTKPSLLDGSIFVNNVEIVNYILEGVKQGVYYFAIATVTQDDTQGAFSEQIAVTIL